MTVEEAKAQIARVCAATYDPQLDDEDLTHLVNTCKRYDVDGRAPDDAEWVPTFDLNYAYAQGWEIKAGRAAGDFRFEEDNQGFYREQVYRHCRQQADRYNRRAVQVPASQLGFGQGF